MRRVISREDRVIALQRMTSEQPEVAREIQDTQETASHEVSIDEFAKSRKKKSVLKQNGKPRVNSTGVKRATEDALRRFRLQRAAGDDRGAQAAAWQGADASTVVGIYGMFHRAVYGEEAIDLAEDWLPACSVARWLIGELGSVYLVSRFQQFVWARIKEQVAKYGPPERRVGWRLAFSRKFVADFRVFMHRKDTLNRRRA